MIENKNDLKEYLIADRNALRITRNRPKFFGDEIWKFEICLRKLEYYTNVKKKKILYLITKYRYHKLSVKCNFYIPVNVFDKGLSIGHIGPIIINDYAKIGKNCRVHVGVNIGATLNKPKDAPIIGNNCYIGPGAKIYGKIKIGNNVAIGANAVVNKDFDDNVMIAGIPAVVKNNTGNYRK